MLTFGKKNIDDPHEFGHDRSIRSLRGRYLVLCGIGAYALSVSVLWLIWWLWGHDVPQTIFGIVWLVSFHPLLIVFMLLFFRRPFYRLIKTIQVHSFNRVRWSVGTGITLYVISIGALYVVYLPLSYLYPEFIDSWVFGRWFQFYWTEGDYFILANVVTLIMVVVVGPLVEELFFRGLLLRVWITKWGPVPAIIVTSVLFSAIHSEYVGPFIGSIFLSLTYIWSRRIEVPILIHMAYNATFSVFEGVALGVFGPHDNTLAEFQAGWWYGVVGLVIGVPVLVWLLLRAPRIVPEIAPSQ